jgi:tetratricopeptide (TPR) repeat protein
LIFGAIYFALRPPYQARQFANGIMLRQSQDLEAALHCFSSAMESDRLRPDALYERGRTYLQRGNGTAAMADFSRASKDYADPRSAAYVGYCFNLQGDLTSAIPWYEVALRQGHDTIGLHNNLGVSYAKGRSVISTFDRLARAQSHLEKAFELDQSSPVVRANLVMLTLVRLESDSSFDAESSLSHLRYLQTVFPRSPRVVADSVQLYSLLSMRDKNYNEEAIHAIKLSLRLGIGPSVRELSTSPRFDTLRADPRFAGIQSAAVATQIVPKRDELDMFIDPVSSAE